MVERTKNYAHKVISEKTMSRRSRFKNWKARNITKMKAFLGLLLIWELLIYLICKTIGQEIYFFNQTAFGNK